MEDGTTSAYQTFVARQEQHRSFPVKILREIKYTEWNSLNQDVHNMRAGTASTGNQAFSVSQLYYYKDKAAFEVLSSAQFLSHVVGYMISLIQ